MDLFVVPTISFRLLYGLLIMSMIGDRSYGSALLPSNGRMDRQSAHRGMRLGANPTLPGPGSRWRLRRDIHPPHPIDRHSRPPDVSAFTVAKRLRRAADRLDPQGMP